MLIEKLRSLYFGTKITFQKSVLAGLEEDVALSKDIAMAIFNALKSATSPQTVNDDEVQLQREHFLGCFDEAEINAFFAGIDLDSSNSSRSKCLGWNHIWQRSFCSGF